METSPGFTRVFQMGSFLDVRGAVSVDGVCVGAGPNVASFLLLRLKHEMEKAQLETRFPSIQLQFAEKLKEELENPDVQALTVQDSAVLLLSQQTHCAKANGLLVQISTATKSL